MAKRGYSSRKRFTEKQIQRLVAENIGSQEATMLITSLVDLLYGKDSDEDWGADTLDALAQLLGHYNLTT